jgi:threonine aldolase
VIELRSDTFTMPTDDMREAMRSARVGNDGYGEDPTVHELEDMAADTVGMQAACLMPSGTMANLAALMVHSPRGSKVLVGEESDIFLYEAGGAAVCGGLVYDPIPNQPDGSLSLADLASRFPDDADDPQFALPALICLENTQNRRGGLALELDYLREVQDFARSRGVPVHMDGARVFNAAVALGIPVSAITEGVDSLQFCLSKGLGAPIGSILTGSAEFIERARRTRKMLGGGMRQAGIIAAAGLLALKNTERLADDHENAQRLAKGLTGLDGVEVGAVQTNIVMFRIVDPRFTWQTFITYAAARGLAVAELGHGRVRAVTHAGISEADIDAAVRIVSEVLANDAS